MGIAMSIFLVPKSAVFSQSLSPRPLGDVSLSWVHTSVTMLVQEMDMAPGMRPCACRELRPAALEHAVMYCFLHGPGVGVPSGVKLPPSQGSQSKLLCPPWDIPPSPDSPGTQHLWLLRWPSGPEWSYRWLLMVSSESVSWFEW